MYKIGQNYIIAAQVSGVTFTTHQQILNFPTELTRVSLTYASGTMYSNYTLKGGIHLEVKNGVVALPYGVEISGINKIFIFGVF